ncbi:uncharacterized protein LOC136071931 [Hydra vulgaris]|uniref:Uncharacterized protein LOC136071931 n=1 Tax=Hydra vulgaris TaxID=6087 RepID=A0ABM4BXE6_HYDVU
MSILRNSRIIFRQLFDSESWTYTYIVGCKTKNKAVIIDPVDKQFDRDRKLLEELGLDITYAVNTHCHADHITGSGLFKSHTKCKSVISKNSGAMADILLSDGDVITFGDQSLQAVATPGHTSGCLTYVSYDGHFAFTGDALLIRGCGRTDFQQGNPGLLYDMVHSKILSLPDDFLLFPAHDYKGNMVTSVAEEKLYNPRLTKSKEEFIEIMKNLGLAYPKQIDVAVPWNLKCGPSQLGQTLEERIASV